MPFWQSVHAANVLLYGLLGVYLVLTIVAGVYSIGRRLLPVWFWTVSLAGLVLVVIQAGAGLTVYLAGTPPRRSLHLLYGALVLAAALIQYGLRPGGFFRRTFAAELSWGEARTLALISLTQFALLLRVWMTGTGVR
jgi:hypothetical protein